ncbi:MAG: hypothetical protein KAI16_00320 [Candidatus Pacebacteria bacterium]|nr:hypothetical protein [Candidatus Paceibacterota bacterium]
MPKDFSHYLPSRFVLFFVIIPAIFFVVFFLTKDYFFKGSFLKNMGQNHPAEIFDLESTERDTDGDGLLDWQEKLYKTDVNKKDTDGDGIVDGIEARMGTDPTDPFNIEFSKKQEIAKKEEKTYKDDENLSKTDVVSRDFFIKLMELKESNLSFNKNAQKQVIDELIKENKVTLFDKYNLEFLEISQNTTIKSFKKELENTLNNYSLENFKDETILFSQWLEEKNDDYLIIINDQVTKYKELEEELLKLKVPNSLKILYLEYINSFVLYVEIIDSLENFKDDPVLVSSMILLYNKAEKRLAGATQSLAHFFKINI